MLHTGPTSWTKGKAALSVIVIIAAIAVGASSYLRKTYAQSGTVGPAGSFSSALDTKTAVPDVDAEKAGPLPQGQEIRFEILESLQTLDTLAAGKDVVFIVMPGQDRQSSQVICKEIAVTLNKLRSLGQKIAAFTFGNTGPDYDRLVNHFAVESFPCVVVLGRGGSASAVSGDISEARLYNAFALATQPAAPE